MVMLLHAHFQLGKGGAIGVDIFFVISGYVVTGMVTNLNKVNLLLKK
jgi:peptidoglycan/LPS O-acetylase OafA/YrhL